MGVEKVNPIGIVNNIIFISFIQCRGITCFVVTVVIMKMPDFVPRGGGVSKIWNFVQTTSMSSRVIMNPFKVMSTIIIFIIVAVGIGVSILVETSKTCTKTWIRFSTSASPWFYTNSISIISATMMA